MKVHFKEKYGTKGEEILYVTSVGQQRVIRVPLIDDKVRKDLFLFRILKILFLPKGYPDSVSDDYCSYQIWDTIQAFCSTIASTLTTHAILKGIGVGNDYISPYSATVTWIFKEGSGHLGKIMFSWWKGSQLDMESKKWRLRADILNDVAMGIEIYLLPKYSEISTYILCGTCVLKSIVGVAGGATRTALTQHHAIRGNLADVSSKDNAQETCVNLIASFVGIYLLTVIENPNILYGIFVILATIHLYANVKAVKSVVLRTFNESRYLIALEEYFRSGKVMTPHEVNKLERVTIGKTVSVSLNIHLGISIKYFVDELKITSAVENYIATHDPHEKFIVCECNKKFIGVFLHFEARQQDVLKAFFFAVSYLQDRSQGTDSSNDVQMKWLEFVNLAQQEGWLTTNHLLLVDEYRLDWKS